ncbi:MAG: hypothetical protein PHS04_06860 [Tissierellia bacterium]|nr:hypothetical protein [Tissierellia bacterium]
MSDDLATSLKDFLAKAFVEDILAEDKHSIKEQLASLGFTSASF